MPVWSRVQCAAMAQVSVLASTACHHKGRLALPVALPDDAARTKRSALGCASATMGSERPAGIVAKFVGYCAFTLRGPNPAVRITEHASHPGAHAFLHQPDLHAPAADHWPLTNSNDYGPTNAAGANETRRIIFGEPVLGLQKSK